ncbi:MAG: alpha/beta hydrolase [Betaproteobacteria bacterium]
MIASAAKVLVAAAVGLPLFVWLAQDRLIFYRQPTTDAQRAQIEKQHPAAARVHLSAADGARLHAWHVKGNGPLVLYFGGNAEEVSWMLDRAVAVPGAGWLLVDYRGYGASEGSPSEAALVSDALAWFDRAATLPGVDRSRIVAFGRSLGSGVAVQLAAKREVRALILATPYDSLAAVARHYYWYLPVDWMLRHRFDSDLLAPAMKQPLLALIAERDEVIPPAHAEALFMAWGGPKHRVLLAGAGHNSSDAHPLFWEAIRAFINEQSKS